MIRTLLTATTIACVLALGVPTGSAASTGDPQLSKIGKATKEAGKDVAKGTKDVAKKAGEVTEDAAQKTAKETKNVGKTVEGAVTPGMKSVRCKDGTVQTVKSGRTGTDACRRHLGVKR
jgi:hypothetical protein